MCGGEFVARLARTRGELLQNIANQISSKKDQTKRATARDLKDMMQQSPKSGKAESSFVTQSGKQPPGPSTVSVTEGLSDFVLPATCAVLL